MVTFNNRHTKKNPVTIPERKRKKNVNFFKFLSQKKFWQKHNERSRNFIVFSSDMKQMNIFQLYTSIASDDEFHIFVYNEWMNEWSKRKMKIFLSFFQVFSITFSYKIEEMNPKKLFHHYLICVLVCVCVGICCVCVFCQAKINSVCLIFVSFEFTVYFFSSLVVVK